MDRVPSTHYAQTADGFNIAYQQMGGGRDVVFIQWLFGHVEAQWADPDVARFRRRLASVCRLIVFDQRGSGLSDPVAVNDLPTLELFVEDVRAVLDEVGSRDAAVVGWNDGGLVAILLAATYPDRVSGLVLIDAFARITHADDGYRGLGDRATMSAGTTALTSAWGSGDAVALWAPSRAADVEFRDRLARMERMSMSPGTVQATMQMINADLDVRGVLPTISTPTLVLEHDPPWPDALASIRSDADVSAVEGESLGRFLAEHIRGARYVALGPGDQLYWANDTDRLVEVIQEFVTGQPAPVLSDRSLATVLFTDIVDSTRRAADLGDRRWTELLAAHHELVRRQLEQFRGREVKTTGDGFLATFDGPARAVRCACAIREAMSGLGVEVRAGLHTGEIELLGDDIGGIAVHIASRIETLADPNQVLVSSTVKDLTAGSEVTFEPRGTHRLKGVPDRWRIYAVS